MQGPLAPGERRAKLAPLPLAALVAGGLLCALALFLAALRPMARALTSEPLVVRALGATLAVLAVMLARVGLRAAKGVRKGVAVLLGLFIGALAAALLVHPALASIPYQRGWGVLVPWVVAVPGILCLVLGRWSMRA